MKKFNLLALALVLGATSLFANHETVNPYKGAMRNEIVQLLAPPNFDLEDEITVNITFTFNTEGKIVVQSVDTKNPDILAYVRETLCHKSIQNPGEVFTTYVLPIHFK